MILAVPKETIPDERRVALVPDLVPRLIKAGLQVQIETGAGLPSGFPDALYVREGAQVKPQILADADLVLVVRPPATVAIAHLKIGATLIGLLEPDSHRAEIDLLAERKIAAFAMELMPRIARAQSMDALSAMSTVAGYKAVLLAANHLHKFFPLLMTAAGTMPPARVFVIGAGVAGLEAIGTAKRLGAIVEAYDVRSVVKEEIESVGARFVEFDLDHAASADVIITAALVRGRPTPILITEEMVRAMRPGSVIVDLAADQGGNCALTKLGQDVVWHGVTIAGPANLPSMMPFHASQMYSRTVVNFLLHLLKDGVLHFDMTDELISATMVAGRP
jgi:NAD(P) transhydrogenase subunit alpha